jgi:1-deoxy-D-xylulose-5-phosphate synthase
LSGGFGSAVLEILEEAGMGGIRTYRIGIPDIVTTHGSRKSLLRLYNIDIEGIVQQVSNFMTRCSLYPVPEEGGPERSMPFKMITKK